MTSWIELVLSVKPASYTKLPKVGRQLSWEGGSLVAKIRTEQYRGFDVKLRGYRVLLENGAVRKQTVPLMADLTCAASG